VRLDKNLQNVGLLAGLRDSQLAVALKIIHFLSKMNWATGAGRFSDLNI
jgi:hypothetical protein